MNEPISPSKIINTVQIITVFLKRFSELSRDVSSLAIGPLVINQTKIITAKRQTPRKPIKAIKSFLT
jgi:hypothetical protein